MKPTIVYTKLLRRQSNQPKQHFNTPPQADITPTRLHIIQPQPLLTGITLRASHSPLNYDGRLRLIAYPKSAALASNPFINANFHSPHMPQNPTNPYTPTHTIRARVQSRAAERAGRAACGPASAEIRTSLLQSPHNIYGTCPCLAPRNPYVLSKNGLESLATPTENRRPDDCHNRYETA